MRKTINIYKISGNFLIVSTDDKWLSERALEVVIPVKEVAKLALEIKKMLSMESPKETDPTWDGKFNGLKVWEEAELYWGIVLEKNRRTTGYTLKVDKYRWASFGKPFYQFTGTYKGSDGTFSIDVVDNTVLAKVIDFMLNAGE